MNSTANHASRVAFRQYVLRRLILVPTIGCLLAGCSPSTTASPSSPTATKSRLADVQRDELASLIATVPVDTIGPYVGYGSQGALTLYAPPSETGRRWLIQLLDKHGSPSSGPYDLGPAPEDTPFATIRPVGDSYLVMWVRRINRADVLSGIVVNQDGSVSGTVSDITQAQGRVLWADAFPGGAPRSSSSVSSPAPSSVVVWVEESDTGAQLRRIVINSNGETTGSTATVAVDVRAWATARIDAGLAVALVVRDDADARGTGKTKESSDTAFGSVKLLLIDGAGNPSGPLVNISEPGTARYDVSIVRTETGLLYAWTARDGDDMRVFIAATDFQGRLTVRPKAPLPPLSDQALVALVQPPRDKQAMLVFEQLPPTTGPHRRLLLTTLSSDGTMTRNMASLLFAPVGVPNGEYVSTQDGFAFVTGATACPSKGPCEEVPWYVRVDDNLSVTGASPVVVQSLSARPPVMMWSPGCTSTECFAIAVGDAIPAPVAAVKLRKTIAKNANKQTGSDASEVNNTMDQALEDDAPGRHTQVGALPISKVLSPAPPLPVSNRTVLGRALLGGGMEIVEPVSSFDVAIAGSTTFVGWVSHHVDGVVGASKQSVSKPPPRSPGSPSKPTSAYLGVARIDGSGIAVGKPTTISVRAMTQGGVALAPNAVGTEACVAWVARDLGSPQVFVTRVGIDGKTLQQRVITQARGDVSDVAIGSFGTGWIVAWVDFRHGNGEVFVAKIGQNLLKVGQEKRVTFANGDASSVALVVAGDEVILAYGDSRDSADKGIANPYVQRLSASSLDRIGDETRVDASENHTRWVGVSRSGQDVFVGWLTESVSAASNGVGQAMLARLNTESMRRTGPIVNVGADGSVGGGVPVSMGFECDRGGCRGALVVVDRGVVDLGRSQQVEISGFSWVATADRVRKGTLARTVGLSTTGVAPSVLGDSIFFVERGDDVEERMRKVTVRWTD